MINGVFTVHDTGGLKTTSVIKNIPTAAAVDLSKMLAFVTSIQAVINGGISSYGVLTWTETAQTPTLVTAEGVNSFKAAVLLRYALSGVQKSVLTWLPNPADASLEMVTGQGLRLTQAMLDVLTAAFTASAGFAVTAVEGKVLTRNWSGPRSRSKSSIQFEDSALQNGYMSIPRDLCTSSGALATLTAAIDASGISASKVTRSFFVVKLEAIPDQTTGIGLAQADADDIKFEPVETAAIAKFSYTASGVKKFEQLRLPSIQRAGCLRSNSKYKLAPLVGSTVATALNTLYSGGSKDVAFVGSKVVGVDLLSQ